MSVEEGTQFYASDLYFGLYYDGSSTPYFECETEGTVGNYIQQGTEALPMVSINNLEQATFGAPIATAVDIESDEDFRTRIKARFAMIGENGNKSHYKEWCEQVDGVGYARIVPLWNGPNTVKAIIFDENGGAASADVVKAVQDHVDPASQGLTAVVNGVTYVVGDGWGEGAANLGAHFTASAPGIFSVNISGKLLLASGASIDTCAARIRSALSTYLTTLDRNSDYGAVIRYYEISSIIMRDDDVLDHTNLTVNGGTQNIALTHEQVCALGTLNLTDANSLTLTVDANSFGSVNLFGKTASNLQSGITISNGSISGTLLYVSDYSAAFAGSEASGNYLALHCAVAENTSATITVEVVGGQHGPVTLDEDGIVVLRIADKDAQSVRVIATASGYSTTTRTFILTGLTLNGA